jgi:hypothetical protein
MKSRQALSSFFNSPEINIFYIAPFLLLVTGTGQPDPEGGQSPSHRPCRKAGRGAIIFSFILNKK